MLAVRPLCVIKEVLSIADSKLSYHLSVLKEAGLIVGEAQENWIIYRLTDEGRCGPNARTWATTNGPIQGMRGDRDRWPDTATGPVRLKSAKRGITVSQGSDKGTRLQPMPGNGRLTVQRHRYRTGREVRLITACENLSPALPRACSRLKIGYLLLIQSFFRLWLPDTWVIATDRSSFSEFEHRQMR